MIDDSATPVPGTEGALDALATSVARAQDASSAPVAAVPIAEATSAVPATEGTATAAASIAVEPRRRKGRQLLVLVAIVAGLLVVSSTAGYYVVTRKPLPIPDIVNPMSGLPHYMYSIYGVDKPIGVAVTPDGGRIYVTELGDQHLLRVLDAGGTTLAESSPPDSTPSSRVPVYDARDPITGEIYVTDRLRERVDIYDASGIYQRYLTPPAAVTGWQPLGVAFDENGMLYVSDVSGETHRVLEIDRAGQVMRTIDHGGKLEFPNGIAPISNTVYVTDSNNGQLVRVPADGPATVVVGRGVGPGDLGLPRGIAADDRGRLYVADITTHAVYVYEVPVERAMRPTFLGSIGQEGRADGEFEFPNAVAADARGHLFISDRENNRIQIWGY